MNSNFTAFREQLDENSEDGSIKLSKIGKMGL